MSSSSAWAWLQEWLYLRTRGYWEVGGQISVTTDSLPALGFELAFTGRLHPRGVHAVSPIVRFERVEVRRSESDWVECWMENERIRVLSSPGHGSDVINGIRSWIEAGLVGAPEFDLTHARNLDSKCPIEWLEAWSSSKCYTSEVEAGGYGVRIHSMPIPGWCVRIALPLVHVHLGERDPLTVAFDRAQDEWASARIRTTEEGSFFEAFCGPRDLAEVIESFRNWASLALLGG